MSFASLKKSSYTDLLSKAESLNKTEVRGADERLWKPEVDKAGTVSYTHLTLPTICSV